MSCGHPGKAFHQARRCAAEATERARKRAVATNLKAAGLRELTAAELKQRGITRVTVRGQLDPREIDPKRAILAGTSGGSARRFLVLAVAADNTLAIVAVKPRVTVREYRTCECPFMLGTQPPPPPSHYIVLPVGASAAEVKRKADVLYDALVITKTGVRRRCQPVP